MGRGIALGVAGALLVFLALTTVQALGNHPPLFYLPESVVMRIGSPAVAIGAARLLSACFGAAGVLMVAWLALILLPSRPRVVVAAAWFVALLPAVPHYSAFVYNDGLGFLASTATLVAGALALRHGPTRWRMTGLAAAAAAAALTRAPGLTLAGVAGLVAAAAVWLHSGRPVRRRLLAAGAPAPRAWRAPLGDVAAWLLLAGWLLLAFLMVAWYDGNGGHTHARYLLPAIGVVAIGAAVGLDALPGARRG